MEKNNLSFPLSRDDAVEDVSLRKANVKHFCLGGNRRQAIAYAANVHFKNAQGCWEDIDNTLESVVTAAGRRMLRNRANAFFVELPERMDANGAVSVTRDGRTFSWSFERTDADGAPMANVATGAELRQLRLARLAQKLPQYVGRTLDSLLSANLSEEMETPEERRMLPIRMRSEARYDQICPGVSVRYSLSGERLKEDILLDNADALDRVVIRLSDAFDYRISEDDELLACVPETGEMAFMMSTPVVYDAAQRFTQAQIQLEKADGFVRMRYVLEENWLRDAVFPVTIDPVIVTKVEDAAIEDAYIWNNPNSNYRNTNFGKAHLMRCGLGEGGESISLIRFKTLVNQRASDTILSAQLRTVAYAYPSATEYFGCYPIKTAWTETGVTWNSMTPGNTNHISDEMLCYVSGTKTACYFDITNLYRSWYQKDANGASRNFGVALRYCGKTDAADKYVEWYAAKYDSESAYGPCMIVNYVSHAGRTSWGQYESLSAGRAGSVHADLYNGNLICEHPDVATTGARMPVSIGHVYNSCLSASDSVGCGMGWRTTMHHSLAKKTFGSLSYYVWTDGSGTDHYFAINGSQPYSDMEGMSLKLSVGASAITIADKNHSVMTFPVVSGETPVWLTKMNDSCDNALSIAYLSAGKISTITDGAGRLLRYAYDASGRLASISAPGCPTVSYAYAGGKLTQVTYSDLSNGCTTYGYKDGTSLLCSAEDFTGVRLSIDYEDPASYDSAAIDNYSVQACRVLAMEQSAGALAGAKKRFEYLHMATRVTAVRDAAQEDGKAITYQFNDGGNVVSMYDELGYAQFNAFSASVPNQQTGASKLQGTVINLLRSVDFSANWANATANAGDSLAVDSGTRCLGLPSLKSVRNGTGESVSSQTVSLIPGKTYTFSAFVKAGAQSRASLRISCGGETRTSQILSLSTAGSGVDGWDRLFATITASAAAATVSLVHAATSGAAWFAAPQLETGSIPNRVNLLTNGNFTRTVENTQNASAVRLFPEDWSVGSGVASGPAGNGVLSTGHGMPDVLTGGAMRMYSDVTDSSICINQTIDVRGASGDTFVLGGWVNTRSVSNHHPLLSCRFHNSDTGAWTAWSDHECSNEWVGWQFACFAIAASVNYDKMEVSANYGKNAQSGMFSNLFLHREQFGESFAYDDKKNLVSTSSLTGEKSGMEYDGFDNLICYVAPGAESSEKYQLTYGDTDAEKQRHLLRSETTPMGVRQTHDYDAHGNLLRTRIQSADDQTAITSETVWQSNGNYPASSTDARGNTVSKVIDSESGLTQSVTDPNSQTVNYTYDASRRVTGVQTTADGKNYKNAYTYEKDRIKTVSHNTTGDAADVTYSFEYDALGRKTSVKVGTQVLSTNVYGSDRSGLLKEVQYGNGGKVRYEYDEFDRPTKVFFDGETAPRREYEYGANGQASFVLEKDLGRKQQTEYDLSERPCQSTLRDAQTDALIYRTTLEYDRRSRPKSFREQTADGVYETTFAYDKDSRPVSIGFDGESQKLEYTYDALCRVSSRKAVGGTECVSRYEYVSGDTARYGSGATTSLIQKIVQPGVSFEYAYDTRGNIVSEKRGSLTTTYVYDALGQLIRVNDPHENATWVYNYDCGGNILSKVKYAYTTGALGAAVQTILYDYGDANWKDKLTAYNGTAITYDAIGNPLNDGERRYEWEAGRRLKKVLMAGDPADGISDGYDSGSGTTLRLSFTNGNLLSGNVSTTTASAKVLRSGTDVTAEYPATAFNWTRTSGNASADAAWNTAHAGMKSVTLTATELSTDVQIQCTLAGTSPAYGTVSVDDTFLVRHTRGEADRNDTLHLENGMLSVTTDGDNYRLAGNDLTALYPQLNGSVTASAWVYRTQPTKTIEFKYNSAGLRVSKIVNGVETKYLLNGKQVMHLTVGNDKLHFFYDAQGWPAKVNYNGIIYTYIHNLQGDIVGILDNSGNLVVEYRYDAWGKSVATIGSLAATLGKHNPFRYRNYMYDNESALYYMKTRFYLPEYARFINSDSCINADQGHTGCNMFCYCSNNSVMYLDSSGRRRISVEVKYYESSWFSDYTDELNQEYLHSGMLVDEIPTPLQIQADYVNASGGTKLSLPIPGIKCKDGKILYPEGTIGDIEYSSETYTCNLWGGVLGSVLGFLSSGNIGDIIDAGIATYAPPLQSLGIGSVISTVSQALSNTLENNGAFVTHPYAINRIKVRYKYDIEVVEVTYSFASGRYLGHNHFAGLEKKARLDFIRK